MRNNTQTLPTLFGLLWKQSFAGAGRAALILAACLAGRGPATAQDLSVENEYLRVKWQRAAAKLEAIAKPSGRRFLAEGRLPGVGRSASAYVGALRNKPLGSAAALEIRAGDGGGARVLLFPGVPFLFLQRILANPTPREGVVDKIPYVRFRLDVDAPATALRVLGTGGLTAPDRNPGSYVFLAAADPAARSGAVAAWLTQDRGSGILFSSVTNRAVEISARLEYGRLAIPARKAVEGELLAIGWFEDARLGLERYADLVAKWHKIHLPPKPDGYCTWYSRPHGGACDEKRLAELARFIAKELKPFGMRFVQIDDGWQDGKRRNGPAKIFIRHNPNGPYPGGMKKTAQALRKEGLIPGIWLMPFVGDRQDPFFADKTDWFVKNPDGSPYFVRWGGTCLDMSYPPARAYLSNVVDRVVHDWGFGYLKLDGLWTGMAAQLLYVNNGYRLDDLGRAVFHDRSLTPIEIYRSGLRLVRQAAGPDVFILGCNVSQNMRTLGASFGLVDAMRIGPDNGPSWRGLKRGPWHASNRYFLHGRVWHNDPDPIYVRPSMPIEHARLLCSWAAVAGTLTVASDWLPELPPERLEILKRALPSHTLRARPADLFETDLPRIWTLKAEAADGPRWIVGLYNWEERQPTRIECDLARLGLDPEGEYAAFDFWGNRFLPPVRGKLAADLPPGSCRVLALRPAASHPFVLSTSRHVTQGVVDIVKEVWNEGDSTLEGTSRVVAGDPYELRLWLPNAEWRATEVSVEGAGAPAKPSVQKSGRTLRVRFTPSRSGAAAWKARFAPPAAAAGTED
ncbi:MAG: alpha-galactosidase [Verrucomicrobia bacterium]|nr:alpha-galactosidase [Verrucomicrobiota bacterium]